MGSRARPRAAVDWIGVYNSTTEAEFALTHDLKEELCEITALDTTAEDGQEMLENVREELSTFRSAKVALDRNPRPAHKLKLLYSVLRRAKHTDPVMVGDHSVNEDQLPQPVILKRMALAPPPAGDEIILSQSKKVFVPAESAAPRLPLKFIGCINLFKTPPTPFDEVERNHCCWVEEAYLLACWPSGPLAWEFRIKGFPEDASLEFIRQNFIAFSELVRKDLVMQESRHGPTEKAKKRLIAELSHIFDFYASVRDEADRQVLKAEFVSVALSGVGFRRANPKKLRDRSTSRLIRQLPTPCIETGK